MGRNRFFLILILIFLILSSVLIAGGYDYYSVQKDHIKNTSINQLGSVGTLKKNEISNWRNERIGDATLFYKNTVFSNLVREYFEKPEDLYYEKLIQTWLNQIVTGYVDYDRIFLLDRQGNEMLSYPTSGDPLSSTIKPISLEVLQSGKIKFIDFYRNENSKKIYLTIIVPILDMENDNNGLGTLIMRIDPEKFIYPFIQSWPVLSDTGETLLVQQEGNEVVYLNKLRFQENTALNLRFSLDNTETPAVKAVIGQRGTVEGIDYRGQKVFAYLDIIPDSPWYIVAKIDQIEIYAPLQERLWSTIIIVSVLILCIFFAIGFFLRKQNIDFFRAKYESEREKTWLLEIIDRSQNEIFIFNDKTLKYNFINKGALDNLGRPLEELLKMTPLDVEPETKEEEFRLMLKPLLTKECKTVVYEAIHKRKDGSEYFAEHHFQHIDRGDGKGVFLAIVNDITDRKKAELELKRSNIELERFVYVASHDLQEPLRMVSSYVMLLEKRYKDKLDSDAHDFINFSVEGVKRMQNLINELLAYSRINTNPKPFKFVDMESVLKAAVDNLKVAITESKTKITHDNLPAVIGDEVQLIQVLQNLIANAIKFSSKRVPLIHISAKPEQGKDEWIFSVKDNGMGIDQQYFDRIFIIFQHLHGREYPGTGAGLAIVKRILEHHGGKVWVESKPGEGSTFYFTIPTEPKKT